MRNGRSSRSSGHDRRPTLRPNTQVLQRVDYVIVFSNRAVTMKSSNETICPVETQVIVLQGSCMIVADHSLRLCFYDLTVHLDDSKTSFPSIMIQSTPPHHIHTLLHRQHTQQTHSSCAFRSLLLQLSLLFFASMINPQHTTILRKKPTFENT
jgi:hypothetical protein